MAHSIPMVSVVLPVYDGGALVSLAIRSIQLQDFTDWELIVVDDGSQDESLDICRKLARADARIHVFSNETNRGLAETMNRLVSLARGKYIAVQEQDDLSEPWRLGLEVQALQQRPEVALVSGVAAWINDEGKVFKHFPGLLHRGDQYPQERSAMVSFLYTEQCKVVNAACMFRRSAVEEIHGPFDAEARMSIDWQFFVHLAHRHRIFGIPRVLVRMRRGSRHQSLTRKKELQFQEARRCIRLLYERYSKHGSSPINHLLYRKAMATELILEGRFYGRMKGFILLLQAIVSQPTKRETWTSLFELCRRVAKRILRKEWFGKGGETRQGIGQPAASL